MESIGLPKPSQEVLLSIPLPRHAKHIHIAHTRRLLVADTYLYPLSSWHAPDRNPF
jgi:hypothetical protein